MFCRGVKGLASLATFETFLERFGCYQKNVQKLSENFWKFLGNLRKSSKTSKIFVKAFSNISKIFKTLQKFLRNLLILSGIF